MATTPGLLPYPLGSDFVVDGDNAIAALAAAVDPQLLVVKGLASDQPLPATTWVTLLGQVPELARGIGYVPGTGLATIGAAGVYQVSAVLTLNPGTATDRLLRITRNGVADPTDSIVTTYALAGTSLVNMQASCTIALNPGDVLRVQAFSFAAVSIRGSNFIGFEPRFTIRRVAP